MAVVDRRDGFRYIFIDSFLWHCRDVRFYSVCDWIHSCQHYYAYRKSDLIKTKLTYSDIQ